MDDPKVKLQQLQAQLLDYDDGHYPLAAFYLADAINLILAVLEKKMDKTDG